MPPFSKPAPSKWDDAQKWILNPKKAEETRCRTQHPPTKIVHEVPEEANPVLQISIPASSIRLIQHESSTSHQTSTAFIAPPSTARAVSMRDMGTEMTPIASQEPSRTATPVRATTPMLSPTSSRPSTPPRRLEMSLANAGSSDCYGDHERRDLDERELRMKTRREIMLLGTQLGKANIAAWASKEEEEKDAAATLKIEPLDQQAKRFIEARATAWEEAEKAKYLARFKREEIKIQAWEDHERAKAETQVKEIEVKVERMKASGQDRLMNKLARIRHKAEEKRAAAEAKRCRQAARAVQQAEYIRRTGRVPSSFTFCCWCN